MNAKFSEGNMSVYSDFNVRTFLSSPPVRELQEGSDQENCTEKSPLLDSHNPYLERSKLMIREFKTHENQVSIAEVKKQLVANIFESTIKQLMQTLQQRKNDFIRENTNFYFLPFCKEFETAAAKCEWIQKHVFLSELHGKDIYIKTVALRNRGLGVDHIISEALFFIADNAVDELNEKFRQFRSQEGNEQMRFKAKVQVSKINMFDIDIRIRVKMESADFRQLSLFQKICEATLVPCIFPCCPVWF